MTLNSAQYHNSQGFPSEGVTFTGCSEFGAEESVDDSPNWGYAYRPEYLYQEEWVDPHQVPESGDWPFDFETLESMNDGTYRPYAALLRLSLMQHQYGTGGNATMIAQADATPDAMQSQSSAYGGHMDANYAGPDTVGDGDGDGDGWPASRDAPPMWHDNNYEPRHSEIGAHVTRFPDGTPTAAAASYALSQSTEDPPYPTYDDNHSPLSEGATPNTSEHAPALYDWRPSPSSTSQTECYFPSKPPPQRHYRESSARVRKATKAVQELKEMERSLQAHTKLRIDQLKNSLPS